MIGLAPQAKVAVYEGPNSGSGPYDTFSAIITHHVAQVVTASWGQCEPLNGFGQAQSENTLFQQAAAEGMSIFSASGDDGSEDCFPEDPTPAVDDPASQPYVTGVGGTHIASLGPRPSENVWNDGVTVGAGGGGVSSFWSMPSYQSAAPASLHVINSGSTGSDCGASSGYCREVPDVSADADPGTGYVIYWNGNGAAGRGECRGLAGGGRHERRRAGVGGPDRADQRLRSVRRGGDRFRQPGPLLRRGDRVLQPLSTMSPRATTT